jgi:ATP-dependent DNA helicase HFM1/MER3
MRFVAVSATLPNIDEIATFLDANEAHVFDDSYRPVPLKVHVIGHGFVGDNNGQFHFWNRLEKDVPNIVHRYSDGRPAIVFCHSKAETERLADILATSNDISRRNVNTDIASRTRYTKLQRVLTHGVGFHHAGLDMDDRRLVEKAFLDHKIRVLCATSTLAMGVNLPAHLVVIKGTRAWRGGSSGYEELDQATLLQMIGRAGRPGFDQSGKAVIMTDNNSKARFESLATSGLDAARSKLLGKLVEAMNVEVSQQVVTSTASALNWLKSSLFFVQLRNQPTYFGAVAASEAGVEDHIASICKNTLQRILDIGAVVDVDGVDVFPTAASHVMSQHLVECQAMESIVSLPHDASQCEVSRLVYFATKATTGKLSTPALSFWFVCCTLPLAL